MQTNLKVKRTTNNETKAYRTSIKKKKQFRVAYMYKVTIEKKDEINEYKKKRKGKDKKKSVPVSPLSWNIYVKSNVDTSIELDTIMCAN